MVKAIIPEQYFRKFELSSIDDELWNRLKKHLPEILTATADAGLRSGVLECCSLFRTENEKVKEAQRTFAAMQKASERQPAELERLAKGLRMAADAWAKLKEQPFHDDRITNISSFDNLEAMAADADRRLTTLRALKPKNAGQPSEEFVRGVAKCCRAAGLQPGVTGSLYDDAGPKLTWFQKFMIAVNDELLGEGGLWPDKRPVFDENEDPWRRAKAALIAKAMRGYGKSGKA